MRRILALALAFAATPAAAAWYQFYTVTTANGLDTYTGVASDGTGFALAAPSGTPACQALGQVCPVTTISAIAFIQRFTPAEQAALMAENPLWGTLIAAAGTIDVTSPKLLPYIAAAVASGALTQARADQILDLSLASP